MTKLKVDGAGEYAFEDVNPFLYDLRLLKPAFGFGWGTVIRHVSQLKVDGSNYLDLLDEDDFPAALCAWVWMLRMRAGERDLTAADAKQLQADQVSFVPDEADRERAAALQAAAAGDDDAEDGGSSPTSAPTDSARGDDEAAPETDEPPPTTSTKTSRPRSSRGSSSSATGGRGSPRK